MIDPRIKTPALRVRLHETQARIAAAAARAGRKPDEIMLIVVTKTHSLEILQALLEAGAEQFGENRAQELLAKLQAVNFARWHFIGHLQRNKAAAIVGRVEIIHSVDSVRLIQELEKHAANAQIRQRILLEINVGEDPNKSGAGTNELPGLLEALTSAPHLDAEGLMTIPPYNENPEASRPHFQRLKSLLQTIPPSPTFNPRHLSMGMSGDFEVAVEEGATMVRVGSAILGERPAK